MYDRKQPEYQQENMQVARAMSDASPLASKASPLQSALNDQGEQLEKLYSLLMDLNARLKPVRVDCPTNDDQSLSAESEPMRSPHTQQVVMQTGLVRGMQACVRSLMVELEV